MTLFPIYLRCDSDPDYEENFLKPELIKMIMRTFSVYFENDELGKFTFRDKVIQCVKAANEVGTLVSQRNRINLKHKHYELLIYFVS